jgi:ATP-dependent helicase/nuclease subunit A
MPNENQIPDRAQRELAETTFDRNVVVVAGAGTGKTTLLVNRLVHLVIKNPNPVPITQIVALTFTNKAATEMRVRLRERLTALVRAAVDDARQSDGGAVSVNDLRTRYSLMLDEVVARAEAALHDLEKAQIGTLHSFAAHLLRLHPLESLVDPAFQEDDGSRFEEHFTAAWDVWIDRELSRRGTNHRFWRTLLRTITVEDLRAFTWALCSELVDVPRLSEQLDPSRSDTMVTTWLAGMRDHAQALLDRHDSPKRRKVEQMLAAAITLLGLLIEKGAGAHHEFPESDREVLVKDLGNPVGGWEPSDFFEASQIIKTSRLCLEVDSQFFKQALKLVTPLVSDIRASFIRKGWLSFDGLLARARRLLRDHPGVRARVKLEYRAVLVDEFQDTDPVQYEIILAVSERQGHQATNWQDMALEPGKLFIVGDPKQSIYAFRRADIEAFDRVVQKIEADQGIVQTLTTNFRSDAAVLGPVNDVFDRLFQRRPHVQPANVRLEVRPHGRPAGTDPGVRLHLVTAPTTDEPFDAAGATRAEAEVLARWLHEDMLKRPTLKPGHVALLFRKLTQADAYLDALRRYGISYVIEGEKHFYRRQEVIDLVNVLRVLDNPHDEVALVGVLRSPLGGLTDRELYDLRQSGSFDYRQYAQLESWSHPCSPAVHRLYRQLARLHHEVAVLPLADAIQLVFDRLPILELAAASLHAEQAVANLLKTKQTAAVMLDRPHLTLSGFVDLMVARLDEQPDEAESPLVEESLEAIQVLTIHKAKGLEFPVVVLPGLHQGTGRERAVPMVSYDWSSGRYGLSLGNRHTFGSLFIHEKLKMREEAERRRVLYVGMTRAKELLMLSGGITARSSGETVLELLQEIGEGEVGKATTKTITIGASSIPHLVVEAPERRRPRRSPPAMSANSTVDPVSVAELWRTRSSAWMQARTAPRQVTPTGVIRQTEPVPLHPVPSGRDSEVGRLVGVSAHRLLERWDFANDPIRFVDHIEAAVQTSLAGNHQDLASIVSESMRELFALFGRSDVYARLRTATILGREIPFMMPWGKSQVMNGVIDVMYRLDETIWIADYKTDAVTPEQAAAHVERYRTQSEVYKAAAKRSLGIEDVRFHCLFLRCATAIEL